MKINFTWSLGIFLTLDKRKEVKMPNIQKYKSIALNHNSGEKLSEIAVYNNRAKGRELAGMIDRRYEDIITNNNPDD